MPGTWRWPCRVLKDPAAAVPAGEARDDQSGGAERVRCADGVNDGFLNDPRACTFDVATLQCKGGDGERLPDRGAGRRPSSAPTRREDRERRGRVPGQGARQRDRVDGVRRAAARRRRLESVRSRSLTTTPAGIRRPFDLDRDLKLVDEKVGSTVNAIDPDLRRSRRAAASCCCITAGTTPRSRPGNTIDYYQSVLDEDGRQAGRLSVCSWCPAWSTAAAARAGPGELDGRRSSAGANRATPLIASTRRGSRQPVDMTRPLCPYPQVAHYKGVGSTNDAANFVCKAK